MRLLSCHIDNFGKLHDYSCDFASDLNMFVHENGWGKSTLAAFLRVMLYGFEGDKRRGKTESERAKYFPWQGGTYGGTLVFEVDGERYRLHRTFGDRSRNDHFVLYDDRTGYETDRLGEPLGEKLFGIDSESFRNSVCMMREDLSAHATVGIHAKIGDLTSDNTDLKSYDHAVQKLKKEADRISPDRTSGAIRKLSERDNLLASRASKEEAMQAAVHSANVKLSYDTSRALSMENSIEKLRKHSDALMRERETIRLHEQLLQLREKESADRKKVRELRGKFPGDIPTVKEINACLEAALASASADNMLRELDQAAQLRRSVKHLHSEGLKEKQTLQTLRKDHDSHRRQVAQTRRIIRYVLYLALSISAFFSVACVWMMFADRPRPTNILGFVIGSSITGLLFFAAQRFQLSPPVDLTSLQYEQDELRCRRRMRTISHEIRRKRDAASLSERQICDFLEANGYAPVLRTAYSNLLQIRSHVRGASAIDIPSPEEFLQHYNIHIGEQPTTDLMELRTLRESLKSAEIQRKASKLERSNFEKLHPEIRGRTLLSTSTEDNDEKLRRDTEAMAALHEKLLAVRRQIDLDEKDLERKRESLRDCVEAKEERIRVLSQKQDLQHQYNVLCKTMFYLQTAKEEFTSRYRNPFLRALKRYYGMITKLPGEKLTTDASFDVKIIECGIPRELHSYSTGSRDLLSVCRRMAMIDVMYPSEKPFLILDDPFVNFDEDTTEGALNFLVSVSKEYQILYFTCHKSRTP